MLRIAHYYEKTVYSCFLPVAHGRHFLVDLTSQFWRYGVSKCRSSLLEERLFKLMMLDNNRWAHAFLQSYIDLTGSQSSTGIFLRHRVQNSINTCLFVVRLLRILHRE